MRETTSNVQIMKAARKSLAGKWGLAIGTLLVYYLITSIQYIPFETLLSAVFGESLEVVSFNKTIVGLHADRFGFLLLLVIGGPLALGLATFELNISRNKEATFSQLFKGFNDFGTAFRAYLLLTLCLLYTSPSPRDATLSRMPSSA